MSEPQDDRRVFLDEATQHQLFEELCRRNQLIVFAALDRAVDATKRINISWRVGGSLLAAVGLVGVLQREIRRTLDSEIASGEYDVDGGIGC